jgi:outer membrane protein assembly factor BamB
MAGLLGALPLVGAVAVPQQLDDRIAVTVDDSPVATRSLSEARSQASDNPARAADLLAGLLDEYGHRLVAYAGNEDLFRSVRAEAISLLRAEPGVLVAWRRDTESQAFALLEQEGIEAAFDRRPLTDAGLEAGLRLAQRSIESGRAAGALRLLEELSTWPGASSARNRILLLRGLAGIDAASTARRPRDRDEFRALSQEVIAELARSDAEAASRLQDIESSRRESEAGRNVGTSELEALRDADWTRIWEEFLPDTLFRRRYFDSVDGKAFSESNAARAMASASSMTAIPVLAGDLVLVNEGFLLRGFDRFTGRMRWYRDFGISRGMRPSGTPGDLGEIVLADGDGYTVIGHAFGGGREGTGEVLRFDPVTGRERWRIRPDRLDSDGMLEGAFVSGPPLVVDDIVALPIRKSNARLETIEFALGLDRSTGAFRWLRTIASSGGVRMGGARTFARFAELEGDIIIASAAGAAARLDGRTGQVRWLRRGTVPLRAPRIAAAPWEIAGPVVLDVGIATLGPAGLNWVLLDPETGEELLRRPVGAGTVAGAVRYLLALPGPPEGRDLLLAVGTDVVAIDVGAAASKPVWTLARSVADARDSNPTSAASEIRGRVTVVGDAVLVPFKDGLAVLDGITGRLVRRIAIPGGGNPAATTTGLFAAGDDRLVAYMPIDDAIATLRARVRQSPDSVVQALALLELAQGLDDRELVVEAAKAAAGGLARQDDPALRTELLDRILESIATTIDATEGELLLTLADAVAMTSSDRVRRELAVGDWMSKQGRLEDATSAWSTVLEEPSLAGVEIPISQDLVATAGGMARSRIAEMADENPGIRAVLNDEAERKLEQALSARATADVFVSVIRHHPGAPASTRAARRAIEILRDEGAPLEAMSVAWLVARDLDPDDPDRAAILEFASTVASQSGRRSMRLALQRAAGDQATVATAPPVDGWMELPDTTIRRPTLEGSPLNMRSIAGSLAVQSSTAALESPVDGVHLVEDDGKTLVFRKGPGLEVVWRLPLAGNGSQIIRHEPTLLLWEGPDRRDPQLNAIDPRTGELLWSTPRATSLLPAPERLVVGADGFLPDSRPFLPFEILPIPVDDGIVLIRRDGVAVNVDAADGRTVKWSRSGLLDRVYGVARSHGLLHLHGASTASDGSSIGRVVSIDPLTGGTVFEADIPGGDVRWLAADQLGRLAVGTTRSITVLDPVEAILGEQRRWTRTDDRLLGVSFGRFEDGRLVVLDDRGLPMVLDSKLGAIDQERWRIPSNPDWIPGGPASILADGDHRYLLYPDRVLLYDASGRLLGADRIADANRMDWSALPTTEGLRLISQRPGRGRYTFRVFTLDPRTGLRITGQPFEVEPTTSRYKRGRAIDGWLLLGTEQEVNAVPLQWPAEKVIPDGP